MVLAPERFNAGLSCYIQMGSFPEVKKISNVQIAFHKLCRLKCSYFTKKRTRSQISKVINEIYSGKYSYKMLSEYMLFSDLKLKAIGNGISICTFTRVHLHEACVIMTC